MKKLRLLIFVSAILCLLSVFTGCGAKKLSTPEGYSVDEETLLLTWDKVENADGYLLQINEQLIESRRNSYSLAELNEGTYSITIKARGDGEYFKDSNWTDPQTFIRNKEAPLYYRPINNGTAYEVAGIGTANGNIEVDSVYRTKPVVRIADTAFANSVRVTSIVLPDSIISIGARSFYNCRNLTSIVIPETVTAVGEYAFQGCSKLTKINLPEAVTVINQYTFSLCRALEEITLGSKITSVGNYAFSDCSALKEIVLTDTLTSIGDYAFSACSAATKIEIGSNVETIGEYAFFRCSSITELDLGDKLVSFGKSAFGDCDAITSITIPDTITKITEYAFYGSENLNEVNFGENVTYVGEYSFYETKLWAEEDDVLYVNNWIVTVKPEAQKNTDFTIPEGTVGIAAYSFQGCNDFSNLFLPNSLKYIGKRAFAGCEIMGVQFGDEDFTDEDGIVGIGEYAFAWCKSLTTIKFFAQKLERIESYAFYQCTLLPSIDLPDTVNFIGTYAFYGTKLWANSNNVVYADDWVVGVNNAAQQAGTLQVKRGTRGLSDFAFYGCSSVNQITLPDTLQYIGSSAFYQCDMLSYVNIPDNIKRIEEFTFYRCFSLSAVDFPSGLEYIGKSAFYQCALLGYETGIVIPGSVETIEQYAFFGCAAIKFVNIGEGVKEIGKRVFQDCVSITNVTLPGTISSLGAQAFYKNLSLTYLTIGDGITEISDFAFYGCNKLLQVYLPSSVEVVGKNAFAKCSSVTDVVFGSGLTTLKDYAFFDCDIKTIDLSGNLTTIGNYAFRNNKNLTSVILPSKIEKLGRHVFYGADNLTFYCEAGEIPALWESYWNSYFRPVFWGTEISEDSKYVVSVMITEDGVPNYDAINGISAPVREGYEFKGWSTTSAYAEIADYTAQNVYEAPAGVKLYAMWAEIEN